MWSYIDTFNDIIVHKYTLIKMYENRYSIQILQNKFTMGSRQISQFYSRLSTAGWYTTTKVWGP